jgi:hypothetical protein
MIDASKSCLPTRFNQDATAFYSPGVLCPSGYTAPPTCSRNDGVRSITTVTCCPVRGDITMSCVADAGTLQNVFSTLFCTWMAGPQTVLLATITDTAGSVQTTAVTMQGREGINAYGVRMVYQSTDLSGIPTSSTAESGGSIGPSNTSTPTPQPSGGLSTGATVAIAVVIPLVVLAILGVAFFMWRRKRQNKQVSGGYTPPLEEYKPPPSSYQSGSPYQHSDMTTPASQGGYYPPPVQQQYKPYEPPAELPGSGEATELPTDNRR